MVVQSGSSSRRSSVLGDTYTSANPIMSPTFPNTGRDPIQIRHVPAPLPTPAPSTPPHSGDPTSQLPRSDAVELVSRPPTPAPSPTLVSRYLALNIEDEDEGMVEGMDVLVEKGKSRQKDGELVGPDLRRESSVDDNCPESLLLRVQRLGKKERMAFLTGLADDLALDEAVSVSRRIEPRLRRDFLKELPLELALHCMSFISDARTLGRSAQVSQYWNQLFSDEQTWKEIYDRHVGRSDTSFIPPADSPFLTHSAQFRLRQGSTSTSSGTGIRATAVGGTSRRATPSSWRGPYGDSFEGRPFAERASSGSFKQQFKTAYLTESNWLHGGQVLANFIRADDGPVTTLCMDDKYVAIGMANSHIHVFDVKTGRLKKNLYGHTQGVWALGLISKNPIDADSQYTTAPTSKRPATSMGTEDHLQSQSRRASVDTGRMQFGILPAFGILDEPRRPSTATGYSSTGPREAKRMKSSDVCGSAMGWPGLRKDLAVSGGSDKSLRVWDIESGRCIRKLDGHRSTLRCLKMLDGRPICVTGSRDSSVKVWNIETGQLLHDLRGHAAAVRCLEVAGNQVVSGSYDTTCRLWDADTGECLHVLSGHVQQIYAVAFDGLRIVAGSADTTTRVWSASTGECIALLQGHTSLVGQLQLTDDILTTGGSDGRIIVFNLATMACLERLCAHDNSVTCLQFDQRFILSGGNDGRAKVWDMQTGRFLRELTRPCEAVWRVAFKDDRAVVLCQRNGGTALEIISFRPEDEKRKVVGR